MCFRLCSQSNACTQHSFKRFIKKSTFTVVLNGSDLCLVDMVCSQYMNMPVEVPAGCMQTKHRIFQNKTCEQHDVYNYIHFTKCRLNWNGYFFRSKQFEFSFISLNTQQTRLRHFCQSVLFAIINKQSDIGSKMPNIFSKFG